MKLFQFKNLEQRKIVFDKNLFQDFFLTKLGYVFVDCKLNEDEYKFETNQTEKFDIFYIHNKNVNVEIWSIPKK